MPRSAPLTAWLLATIAACLLAVDLGQLLLAAEPANAIELFLASITLATGAALSAWVQATWQD